VKPFPWRIGPARSNPSLRDSCGISPRDDDSLIWPKAIRPFAIRSGEGKGAGFLIEQPLQRLAAAQ